LKVASPKLLTAKLAKECREGREEKKNKIFLATFAAVLSDLGG
jgi:hypothetical protein